MHCAASHRQLIVRHGGREAARRPVSLLAILKFLLCSLQVVQEPSSVCLDVFDVLSLVRFGPARPRASSETSHDCGNLDYDSASEYLSCPCRQSGRVPVCSFRLTVLVQDPSEVHETLRGLSVQRSRRGRLLVRSQGCLLPLRNVRRFWSWRARRCGGWLSFASVFAWGLPFGQRLYSDGRSPSPGLAVLSALRASLGFRLQRGISRWLSRHSLRGWRSVSRSSRLLSGLGRNCSLRVFHL